MRIVITDDDSADDNKKLTTKEKRSLEDALKTLFVRLRNMECSAKSILLNC